MNDEEGYYGDITKFEIVLESITRIRPFFDNKLHYDMEYVRNYKLTNLIAQGTYGMVFKCVHTNTNNVMAAKKLIILRNRDVFRYIPSNIYSELKILNMIKHDNIVFVKDVAVKKCGVFILMEYMEHDLGGIVKSDIKLTEDQIRAIIIQMLRALQYLHSKDIIHRDIKCSNILINRKGTVKITHFGFSKQVEHVRDFKNLSKKITSMAYRPPEIILRDTSYGFPVDIWALGCILIMLHTGCEPFLGKTENDVLKKIFEMCGTPSKYNYAKALRLHRYKVLRLGDIKKTNLRNILKKFMTNDEIQLAKLLLTLDPKKRVTATAALKCKWLRNFDITGIYPPSLAGAEEYRDQHIAMNLNL